MSLLGKANGWWIELGPDEVAIAKLVGSRRWESCNRAGSASTHYEREASAEQDWHSTGAEIAAARALNVYPTAFVGKGSANSTADIGGHQARSTPYDQGALFVYEEDDPDQVYFLVCGTLPRYRMAGWILGADAKQQRHWSNTVKGVVLKHPCFVIEQRELAVRW